MAKVSGIRAVVAGAALTVSAMGISGCREGSAEIDSNKPAVESKGSAPISPSTTMVEGSVVLLDLVSCDSNPYIPDNSPDCVNQDAVVKSFYSGLAERFGLTGTEDPNLLLGIGQALVNFCTSGERNYVQTVPGYEMQQNDDQYREFQVGQFAVNTANDRTLGQACADYNVIQQYAK